MSEPASRDGLSSDAADIASTDTTQTPSSRDEETQPEFGEGRGRGGLPMEPPTEAVHRLRDEVDELRDRHARLAAEFDNYRKRVNRERAELGDRAQAAFVLRLLDVLDDVDRLVAGDEIPLPTLREGVALVDKKLRKELESAGLERIDPAGQPFNPAEHEAVATTPAPSADLDHQVSATFQVGYRFKGTLVRPARVQVYSEPGQN